MTFLLAAAIAVLACFHGREIAAEYHLLRLRADPARLLGLLEAEDGSGNALAVQGFLQAERGSTALLESYFELLEKVLNQDLQKQIAGAATVLSELTDASVSLSWSSLSGETRSIDHSLRGAEAFNLSASSGSGTA